MSSSRSSLVELIAPSPPMRTLPSRDLPQWDRARAGSRSAHTTQHEDESASAPGAVFPVENATPPSLPATTAHSASSNRMTWTEEREQHMDEHESADPKSVIPFAFGWYGSGLGTYRPCAWSYDIYSYESLPPIPAPDPKFAFLTLDEQAVESTSVTDSMRDEWRRLEGLLQEAKSLDLTLPDSFLRFMSDARLRGQTEVPSQTCCWFHLSNCLVRCPELDGAYLISFLRDQQDCVVWCLCLIPGGQYYVLAVNDDALMTLSELEYDALLGNLEFDEVTDEIRAAVRRELSADGVAETARSGIFICAPSFESFIYRLWFENGLGEKIDPFNTTLLAPLTDTEQRYLDHYTQVDQY